MKKSDRPTWAECLAAGMTASQAAAARGVSYQAARQWAQGNDVKFANPWADPEFAERHRERGRERMKALHADPEFAERHRERMKALNADPEFAERHRERGRERMKALHADPEFAERNRERMKALNADPEFAERHRERGRERMKALHADPDYNPLVLLSDAERQDYNLLRHKGGLSRNDALRAIRRGDLVRGAE